ncbi:MAG: hypothetical protein R2766_03405 [Saprospiraceae bacterium]
MIVLFETDRLRIEHEFEYAYLIEKSSGKELLFDEFYGDPKCGLISKNNDWAIIAGEHLTIWRANKRKNNQIVRIEHDELKWIHDIKLKSEYIIEILIDPWSENSSIWQMEIDSLKFLKHREFKDYLKTEYIENINW